MRYSRQLNVGPGGIDCPCCMDARGTKGRRMKFRAAKRRDAREAIRVGMMECEEC